MVFIGGHSYESGAMIQKRNSWRQLRGFRITTQIQFEQVLQLARERGTFRAKCLKPMGIPRAVLSRLVEKGALLRVGRGLYMHPEADITEHHTLVEVTLSAPECVVNLLSALAFHELTTELPHAVWIAIGRVAHSPKLAYPTLQLTRTSPRFLELGIEAHEIEGVRIRVTTPARTVVDCFKYRSRVGLDVALDALRDYRRRYRGGADELWLMAGECRVQTVLRPYWEALG